MQDYERKFEQLSDDHKLSKLCFDAGLKIVERGQFLLILSEGQKLSKLCSDAGFKLVEVGQYFFTLETEQGQEMQHLCREYSMPRKEKETHAKGWILKNTKIGPVLDVKSLSPSRSLRC